MNESDMIIGENAKSQPYFLTKSRNGSLKIRHLEWVKEMSNRHRKPNLINMLL